MKNISLKLKSTLNTEVVCMVLSDTRPSMFFNKYLEGRNFKNMISG